MSNRKLLVVEDNAHDKELIELELAGKYDDVRFVSTLAAAREAMKQNQPDAVLLDVNLPDSKDKMDALASIKRMRTHATIIIVSGRMTSELAEQWIMGNASGCVSKDNLGTLSHEIEQGIRAHLAQVSGEKARQSMGSA